jgi:hypothetical protein
MAAAEMDRSRKYVRRALRTVVWRGVAALAILNPVFRTVLAR